MLELHAQSSRLIIVVVQLGAVKIYVAAVEALRKKERQDETQFTTKITQETMLMYFFCRFFFESHPVYDQLRVLGTVFSWLHGYLYFVTGFGVLFSCIF